MKFFYFLFPFLIFFSLQYAFSRCVDANHLEKISYLNGTLKNETFFCQFGCSTSIDTCRTPPITTAFIFVFFLVVSFILLGMLKYPFNLYNAIFFILLAILLIVSDVLNGTSRLLAILSTLVYLTFAMAKLIRGSENE